MFFSFIHDQATADQDILWKVYYDLYLDNPTLDLLQGQVRRLVEVSRTLEDWQRSSYASFLRFCDEDSLASVRALWQRYMSAAKDDPELLKRFKRNLQLSRNLKDAKFGSSGLTTATGLRSTAPLILKGKHAEVLKANEDFWKDGSGFNSSLGGQPNPLYAESMSQNTYLHYGTDQILGFHLATAYASLDASSPLRTRKTRPQALDIVRVAKTHLREWLSAFRKVKGRLVLRFGISDALVFCHTLQHASQTHHTTANYFRRQFDTRTLVLNSADYGAGGKAPVVFDTIDTSNLADHLGPLNLLIASSPLLKKRLSSTLFLETLLKREKDEKTQFDKLLCGHGPTVSYLLGISCVEYWTNATTVSSLGETFLSAPEGEQVHTRLAWKLNESLSGQCEPANLATTDAQALAKTVFRTYLEMFTYENLTSLFTGSPGQALGDLLKAVHPHFHRGGLVALVKLIRSKIDTAWLIVCQALVNMIKQDRILLMSTNYIQDFCAQLSLQGLYTEPWLRNEIRRDVPDFNTWKTIPEVVALTLITTRTKFSRLFKGDATFASPTLQCVLSSSPQAVLRWQNIFSDIHLVFGDICLKGKQNSDECSLSIDADPNGWSGNSPLVVSFYVPVAALQVEPKTAIIKLWIAPSVQALKMFQGTLGLDMTVNQAAISDKEHVYISKYLPGQNGYPIAGGVATTNDSVASIGKMKETATISVDINGQLGVITSLTGRIDIVSKQGKALLTDKAPIELFQKSPFDIDIVFGKHELTYPIHFPVPVAREKSKTRIARKSGFVEVIAPLAHAATAESLAGFVFPIWLYSNRIPVTCNIPHLNLDRLPKLRLSDVKANDWLQTLTSFQFSARESELWKSSSRPQSTNGPAFARLDFKDSLFTIFIMASGLQGRHSRIFGIGHPDRGGVHILLLVGALRLDGAAGSVVVDAAVIPLTMDIVMAPEMRGFFADSGRGGGGEGTTTIVKVDDAELALWKRVLPALAERCRSWDHGPACEYRKPGAAVPLSLEHGAPVLCGCGRGKLPADFAIPGLRHWDAARRHATRVAISPTYALPFVEELLETRLRGLMSGGLGNLGLNNSSSSSGGGGGGSNVLATEKDEVKCSTCGKKEGNDDVKLRKCARCQKAKYCSVECQRKDWADKHRAECQKM